MEITSLFNFKSRLKNTGAYDELGKFLCGNVCSSTDVALWVLNSEELLIIREVKMFLAQRRKGKIPHKKKKPQ